ncbi:MAG: hypothetical protein JWQ69_1175 [Pseudomonas sp.]|nr:hypothetical protein [Pseudomonas sp.]
MSTLTIEGWRKVGDQKSIPMGEIHFIIEGEVHKRLEQAEEYLQKSHELEVMVDVDMNSLELIMPQGYGPLSDCQLRVYLNKDKDDPRGQFHLVGHPADGSLIYTNAVLIAQLS